MLWAVFSVVVSRLWPLTLETIVLKRDHRGQRRDEDFQHLVLLRVLERELRLVVDEQRGAAGKDVGLELRKKAAAGELAGLEGQVDEVMEALGPDENFGTARDASW